MTTSPSRSEPRAEALFEGLLFDNSFVRELPADPSTENRPRQVQDACYSRVDPTPVAAPTLLAHASEVARLVGLGSVDADEPSASKALAEVFGGSRLLDGMAPFAARYGGHQFGHWAGQLGDGRAITLGEVVGGPEGRQELQLKGAGPTPYSRSADGRAVLRSSIREFLCSEAMHHLGVPTTRALSLVGTGERILRDMFYDGNPEMEPGAVVCRVAPSFLRFGNFQILAARGEVPLLSQLVAYAIRLHFPHLLPPGAGTGPADEVPHDVILEWLAEICRRTADMVVHWMRVGFVHGVMNTDNMSILGLTIDYGPYGWVDDYDPQWTPNTTDAQGRRYAYGRQPQVALWNLARFAESLGPLLGTMEPLEEALGEYGRAFRDGWENTMAAKLGLRGWRGDEKSDGDGPLVESLLELLQVTETDMTLFFRRLAEIPSAPDIDDEALLAPLRDAYYDTKAAARPDVRQRTLAWLRRYRRRLAEDGRPDPERRDAMDRVNPIYVLRNYLAQLAIRKAEAGDPSGVHELLEALRSPYDERPEAAHLGVKRPDWARHEPGCSMLSCSS
ncbi:MAG: YdiU family protein [Acidobacteriota bacterium]